MSSPYLKTENGSNYYHIFIDSCSIRFSSTMAGNCLMVGGGGGGGSYFGGGGGAGGVVYNTNTIFTSGQIYTINIGYGGEPGVNGGNTTISGDFYNIAYGGGYGGGTIGNASIYNNCAYAADCSSDYIGSGGGGSGHTLFMNNNLSNYSQSGGKTNNTNQGHKGGNGVLNSTENGSGGGGGGAGEGGYDGTVSTPQGGNGGSGTNLYSSLITDIRDTVNSSVSGWTTATTNGYIAGGGSGGTYYFANGASPSASNGGGGQGGIWSYGGNTSIDHSATSGFKNTGGGGGGGSDNIYVSGKSGGSGLIVLVFTSVVTITLYPSSSAGTGAIIGSSLSLTGYLNSYSATNQKYINSITSSNSITSGSFSGNLVSLNASYSIASSIGFTINSDKRIKKNIEPLSSTDSLEIVKALNPCQYNYIDYMKGTVSKYGYLAQEVEALLPNVVNQHSGYIPNFFEIVKIENQHTILLDQKITESLAIGTKVQFYDIRNNVIIREVREIVDEKTFIITEPFLEITDSLFLYGQEVHDYRSIDTDQINTILLSALQETDKIMEKQKNRLENLKTKWSEYKKKNPK